MITTRHLHKSTHLHIFWRMTGNHWSKDVGTKNDLKPKKLFNWKFSLFIFSFPKWDVNKRKNPDYLAQQTIYIIDRVFFVPRTKALLTINSHFLKQQQKKDSLERFFRFIEKTNKSENGVLIYFQNKETNKYFQNVPTSCIRV